MSQSLRRTAALDPQHRGNLNAAFARVAKSTAHCRSASILRSGADYGQFRSRSLTPVAFRASRSSQNDFSSMAIGRADLFPMRGV